MEHMGIMSGFTQGCQNQLPSTSTKLRGCRALVARHGRWRRCGRGEGIEAKVVWETRGKADGLKMGKCSMGLTIQICDLNRFNY